ncbi:MAG: putative toxin-antitoxin system toxin component, PIN family [Candidatus Berkelbacteria bacterium]|nr:putative toxin-antitoxin system toxin component, PIN family [Candidatus Berkelbacteria bacterium]
MSKNSSANFRVVFDANVFIAAFLRPGLCETLLEKANQGVFELYVTDSILDEALNKLKVKMNATESDRERFSQHIHNIARFVTPKEKLTVVKSDPDDNKILECAVEARANLIISLDHHLLDLKSFEQIGIVYPKTLRYILPVD